MLREKEDSNSKKIATKAFTLIELLIVIAIIAILAAAVIIAVNPGEQLAKARDATRERHVKALESALYVYQYDNMVFPAGIEETLTEICNTNIEGVACGGLIDLSSLELASIPVDPQGGVDDNGTGYTVAKINDKIALDSLSSETKLIGIYPAGFTKNIAPYSDYSNRTYGQEYNASSWGGDAATVYYYENGGYNNLPYKKLSKTIAGTGGSYLDDNYPIVIEDNKEYIISAWIKASRNATVNAYVICINRKIDNQYRTSSNYNLTTEWKRYSWKYVAGIDHAGLYQTRHIIYIDEDLPLDIYWSGFQIEEITGTSRELPSFFQLTGSLD